MPPSVTIATFAPPRRASTRSGVRRSSLPSKYETTSPGDGDVEVPGEPGEPPGVLGGDDVRRCERLAQAGGGVADVAQRRADQHQPAPSGLSATVFPSAPDPDESITRRPVDSGRRAGRSSLRSRGDSGGDS